MSAIDATPSERWTATSNAVTNAPAIGAPPSHVQSTAATVRDGFPYFTFHESVSALWSEKWRPPCAAGIYPFTDGKVEDFDISTGGYYAFRVAHTHADRLLGVVAQGGGCHHMFDAAWIGAPDQMEYPFALAEALAYTFGYRDADPAAAVARYAAEGHKFSLVDAGVVGTPACRLLVIDGMEDSIFPIEDNFLVAVRGDKKDLVARGDRGHMGNPGAEGILYQWIDDVVAGKP